LMSVSKLALGSVASATGIPPQLVVTRLSCRRVLGLAAQ
jgi:hypothetical protein